MAGRRRPNDPLQLGKRKRRYSGIISALAVGSTLLALSYQDVQASVGEQHRRTILSTQSFEAGQPIKKADEIVLSVTVFLTTASGSTWSVPGDCNIITSVDCIAAGGGSNGTSSGGGGGGAWAQSVNITVTPSSTINIGVGVGSIGSGTDTWFNATSLALSLIHI